MVVTGYCVGCKSKGMKMDDVKVVQLSNGRYQAKGFCSSDCKKKDGSKMPMSVFMSEENAKKEAGDKVIPKLPAPPKKAKKSPKKKSKKDTKKESDEEKESSTTDEEGSE